MTPQDDSPLREALAMTKGLQNLLCNMPDEQMHYLEPFELQCLLEPIVERLEKFIG